MEHGDQLDVAAAVGDQPEHRQRERDFGRVEVARRAVGIGGQPLREQHRQHRREGRRLRPRQNREVAIAQRGVLAHHLTDAAGDEQPLPLGGAHLGDGFVDRLALLRGALEQVDLHRLAGVGGVEARVQPRERVVLDLGVAAGHGALEYGVDEFEHGRLRAEVARQRQQLPAVARAEAGILFDEQPRLGHAEPVDRLLDVADHEQIVRPRHARDDGLLDVGGVLIFIDEHIVELLAHSAGSLLIPKRDERAALEIGIRQPGALRLLLLEALGGAGGEPAQFGQLRRLRAGVGDGLRGGMVEHLHALERRFRAVAQRLDGLDGLLVGHFAAPAARRPRGLEVLNRAQQRVVFVDFAHLREAGQVGLRGREVVRRAAGHRRGLAKRDGRLVDGTVRGAHQLGHPFGNHAVRADRAGEPLLRLGALLQRAAERFSQRADVLRPAAVVERAKRLRRLGVGILKRLVERLVHQLLARGIVEHAEGGIDPGDLEVRAQKVGAEGVQRGDARALEADQLVAAAGVAFGSEGVHPLGELGAHVRRRGARERDDQHPVDVRAVVEDQPEHALHQHGGLSGTGRRAQEQALAPRADCARLFVRPTHSVRSFGLDSVSPGGHLCAPGSDLTR